MSTHSDQTDTTTYEGRLDAIFALVREAGVKGVSVAELAERVPWTTDTHEMRGKLIGLRSRDCVFYDEYARRWFA